MPLNPPLLGAWTLGDEELTLLGEVIRRRELFRFPSDGEPSHNEQLETELASWLGTPSACTMSSGTAALRAALHAAGIGAGQRVLVSAFTFVASASALVSLGAVPVPLDMGESLEVDLDDLQRKLPGCQAVVPVYAPGLTSNVAQVAALAADYGVPVIEDACQALGVAGAGVTGDLGVYSFQQGKQLAAGEGGAVVARSPALLDRARRFADHGACRPEGGLPTWEPDEAGFGENLRLGELQAAVLRPQLARLDDMLGWQRSLRDELAARAQAGPRLVTSVDPSGDTGSYLLLLLPSEDAAARAIERGREFDLVLRWIWRQPFCDLRPYRDTFASQDSDDVPRARAWAGRLLGFPVPPLVDGAHRQQLLDRVEQLFAPGAPWR